MKYFILFGPPGAGKGTHAAPMAKKYNLKHLSTGELLRAEIAEGTELGLKAKELIDGGNLVPDEVVEGMIAKAFGKYRDVAGFLLDGFPRTVTQAYDLKEMLEARDEHVTAVISLMIPDELIKERIAGRAKIEGRADDAKPEVIENRIRTYHEKTEPLIELYRDEGIYHEVDSVGTIAEVEERVSRTVADILAQED
ncbi:MAG: adenylate kinase [Bacteroidales bacterium]|nr:adenylate kinase [Bacteroidales bacterium]